MRCVSLIPVLLLATITHAANVCKVSDESTGVVYDLSSLSASQDYEIADGDAPVIKLNICRSVHSEVYKVEHPEEVGIYRDGEQGGESLGKVHDDPVIVPAAKGEPAPHALSVRYPAGSSCPAGGSYSSVLLLECDSSMYGNGHPVLVGKSDGGCAYFFVWKSPAACPHAPGRGLLSALLVFLMVVIVAALTAIGSTLAYNRLVLKKRGRDQFPTVPGSAGGFVSGIVERIRSLFESFRPRDRRHFRGLPTDEEETDLFGAIDEDEED